MRWNEREQGQEAFKRGQSFSSNPYKETYSSAYEQHVKSRDWEDGYREARLKDERKKQEEQERRRQEAIRDRNARIQREQEEQERNEEREDT